jgi:N-acylneuraminate cytidylyltransferase
VSLPRVLAVVPARGGSKGLPGKNVREVAGLPLVAHSIGAAALMPSLTRCVVSTDAPDIAAVARAHGGDVPFRRPAELARDETPMAPVLRHALAAVEEQEGAAYDVVVLLDPTSPGRDPRRVEEAIAALLADATLDGVISVSEPTFSPVWVGVRERPEDPGVLERYFAQGGGITRRQDAPRYLRINGSFYVWRAEFVRRLETSWFDEGRHAMVEVPEVEAFSIDDEYELRLLQAVIEAGLVHLPWLRTSPGEAR